MTNFHGKEFLWFSQLYFTPGSILLVVKNKKRQKNPKQQQQNKETKPKNNNKKQAKTNIFFFPSPYSAEKYSPGNKCTCVKASKRTLVTLKMDLERCTTRVNISFCAPKWLARAAIPRRAAALTLLSRAPKSPPTPCLCPQLSNNRRKELRSNLVKPKQKHNWIDKL